MSLCLSSQTVLIFHPMILFLNKAFMLCYGFLRCLQLPCIFSLRRKKFFLQKLFLLFNRFQVFPAALEFCLNGFQFLPAGLMIFPTFQPGLLFVFSLLCQAVQLFRGMFQIFFLHSAISTKLLCLCLFICQLT